jgi:anaerobic magnesium-protoporphyrin IX monomethyl ester cyclase
MTDTDLVLISQHQLGRHEVYANMPLERVELFRKLVQLRMVYFEGGFRSHLDLLNRARFGKYFHEAPYAERRNMYSIWNLPGANAHLAAAPVIAAGYGVRILNNLGAERDLLELYARGRRRPLIGLSTTYILQWSELGDAVRQIRDSLPEADVILGGAFVNDQFVTSGAEVFERPMRKYGIRYCLFGFNSEGDLLALIECLCGVGRAIEDVNNLAYISEGGDFRVTREQWSEPQVARCVDLAALVDRDIPSRTVQIRTSSGCPFQCHFCSYPATAHGHHPATVESVRLQLELIRDMADVEAVVFLDDTFNMPPERFRQILVLLGQYPYRWYSFCRPQFVDRGLARLMKESGCDGVYAGLESANDIVLANMNKKATAKAYARGIEALKAAEIPVFAAFIVGYPGETEQSVQDDVEFIEQFRPEFYGLKEFFYLHNSQVHVLRDQFGLHGSGPTWAHDTMNSDEATVMKLRIYDRVKNSTYVDADMGLWYLIYLRDRGWSWEQIRSAQALINEMMRRDNAGDYFSKDGLFGQLAQCVPGPVRSRAY